MNHLKKYVMFGAGNLLGELVDLIHLNGGVLKKVVLNQPVSIEEKLSRIPYPVAVESLENFSPQADEFYLIGFKGSQMISLRSYLKTRFSLRFEILIHPTAITSSTTQLGEGSILNAGVIIGSHTILGQHVVVNRGATIGHDAKLSDYVFIGPSATVCGAVRVEEGASIFAGATVIENLVIGAGSQVGAGAVCLKSIPPHVLAVGVPAVIKKSIAGSLTDQLADERHIFSLDL